MMQKVVALIPARFASSRFPGKPLALIHGLPMIQHVYQRVVQARSIDRVIVATDDQRIADAVGHFGGEAMLTDPDHATGTDRLAEVANKIDVDLVVNVQGDEPLIDPRMIDQAVEPMLQHPEYEMGTLATRITEVDDFYNPNVVKVVLEQNGLALYFSRSAIPCPRDLSRQDLAARLPQMGLLRHIGLYVYRRDLLLAYPSWPQTPLEALENLEQLRALERGVKLHVAVTQYSCHGVDTPEDLERVSRLLNAENI